MKKIMKWGACLAVVLLVACAQVGLAPAQSFDERLAYGYSTVTSVRTSAAAALNTGAISVTDAEHALTVTDQARAGLDAAKVSNGVGDTSTATGKLAAATSVLVEVQQYLAAKGVK